MSESLAWVTSGQYLSQAEESRRPLIESPNGMYVWNPETLHYVRFSERDLQLAITSWAGRSGRSTLQTTISTLVNNVMARLRDNRGPSMNTWCNPCNDAEAHHEWVSFRNGIVDLTDTLAGKPRMVPNEPRFLAEYSMPYDFDPKANSPLLDRCLKDWFPKEPQARLFLQEYLGYLLMPDFSMESVLFLVGTGANGKSAFLEMVTAVLGRRNISAMPFEAIRNRFAFSETLGKLAVVASEFDRSRKGSVEVLKKWASGEPMHFELKYKNPFTEKPTARPIFAGNSIPVVDDPSDGFWRRCFPLEFRETFREGTRDPALKSKFWSERTAGYNWALEGLTRLRAQGGFTEVPSMLDTRKAFVEVSEPIRSFAESCVMWSRDSDTPKADVYKAWTAWSADHNVRETYSSAEFFSRFRENFGKLYTETRPRALASRGRVLRGLKLIRENFHE